MSLQPNEVKTEHIADRAVITSKIAPLAVGTSQLAAQGVTTEKIADASVTRDKIGESQVTGSRLRDAGITTPKLANNAVTKDKIAVGAVSADRLAGNAVTAEKIAPGAVTTPKIGELQVTTLHLKNAIITTPKIANNAVTTQKIANGSVTPAKLSFVPPSIARPITPPAATTEIADLAITTPKIIDGAITNAKLQYDKLPLIREKVWGVSVPAVSGGVVANMGLFTGVFSIGNVANANDADGRAKNYSTPPTNDQDAGNVTWVGEYVLTQPRYNPALVCKFKLGDTTNLRFMCGLQSNYALSSDDPSNMSCILLRASTSAPNSNFIAYVSDGVSSSYADFPIPVPIDTNLHILEIAISNNGTTIRFTLDSQSIYMSGPIPAVNQDLGFECRIKTLENASKSFRYYGSQIIQNK